MRPLHVVALVACAVAYGCSGGGSQPPGRDASAGDTSFAGFPSTDSGAGGGDSGADASAGGAGTGGSAGTGPCTTRISYGDAWIHPSNHPDQFDEVAGTVTWDGSCADDGQNSTATLSNGWKPYFSGHSACVMALDTTCPGAPACTTRISYGKNWIPAPNHPAQYDDVPGRVFWNRSCVSQAPPPTRRCRTAGLRTSTAPARCRSGTTDAAACTTIPSSRRAAPIPA